MKGGKTMLTAELLEPIVTGVTSNITTILPIGLSIMAAMVGVSMIPRIIYKFL